MRLPIALLACALLACVADGRTAAAAMFPYKAFVAADEVYVRSGPGENFYPTDKLKAGDPVEVYRRDPGGWCAIRPVPGSFSWVSGRYLRFGRDNIATVTEEHVAARVGSRLSDARDVIQVWLRRGETVEVLEARATARPRRRTPGTRSPRRRASFAGFRASSSMRTFLATACERRPPTTTRGAWRPPAASAARPRPSARCRPQQFEAEVVEVDLELSMQVAEEPNVWRFDDLRTRSEALLNQAETRSIAARAAAA